jgi:hypothetical protein
VSRTIVDLIAPLSDHFDALGFNKARVTIRLDTILELESLRRQMCEDLQADIGIDHFLISHERAKGLGGRPGALMRVFNAEFTLRIKDCICTFEAEERIRLPWPGTP